MTTEQVEELAMAVVSERLPDLEDTNQSYYYGFVKAMMEITKRSYDFSNHSFKEDSDYVKGIIRDELELLVKALR